MKVSVIGRRNICYCRIGCTDGVRFNCDFILFAAAVVVDDDDATTDGSDDDGDVDKEGDDMFCESLCSIAIN